jgi:tetratricopeptide (TPR) repeat protein
VIVLGLLIWAVHVHSKKNEAEASRLLGEAQSLLHPISADGQAGGQEEGVDPEAAAKAMVLLQDLVENYHRTEASRLARILLGQRQYEDGDHDAAIETYKVYLKRGNRKPELTAMAWNGLAYCYEAKEDFAEAATWYEKLSHTSMTHLRGWAYLGMARCYEKLGEIRKATDAYNTLLADFPQHPKAAEARASIARMAPSLDAEDH